MAQRRDEALAKVAKVPPEEQDAIGELILEALEDEQRWDTAFAGSQDALRRLADQLRADIRGGEYASNA